MTSDLSAVQAIILGLVEGVTEYLPISSTGHLLVTNEILGLGGTASEDRALEAYAICIQAGAILAVFVVYLDRIRQMFEGLLGRSEEGRRVLLAVLTSFVPTAVIAVAIPTRATLPRATGPAVALTASNGAPASVTAAELGSNTATPPIAGVATHRRSWRPGR